MEKIGPVGEKIQVKKSGVKNSSWKMDGKNWSSPLTIYSQTADISVLPYTKVRQRC